MNRCRPPKTRGILFIAVLAIASCSTAGASPDVPSTGPSDEPSAPAQATPAGSATTSQTIAPALVGEWVRVQSCGEQLAAFEQAGLAQTHVMSIVGNWVGEEASPVPGKECDGARPPEEHSHFFTEDGRFGSRDAQGQQVDDGDYVMVDADTLSFPSHAREFGYAGDILVDYEVGGDTGEFHVQLPEGCEAACADAYAWALSAFFDAKTWERTPE